MKGNLLQKQKEKIIYYLKSKYSTEKIEKAEKILRYVCCFLIFINMCTFMLNIRVFAGDIEELITSETGVLTVVVSNEQSQQADTQEIKTYTLDKFSKEIDEVSSNINLTDGDENTYATKRLIVLSDTSEFDNFNAKSVISYDNLYVLSYNTEDQCKKAYQSLSNSNNIISVEIDSIMEVEKNSTEDYVEENGLKSAETELKKYLNSKESTEEVKVAILDTGIDTENDIFKNIMTDVDINSIKDDNGHGTEIATLVVNNSNENIKLMPIKIANSDGKATVLNTYIGIKKAIDSKANVINISMNAVASTQSQILTNIINEATNKGIIVVVSAGNNASDVSKYTPSNIDSAIVVSAVENDNTFSKYSNYGETIDYSSYGSYNGKTGTSYATARVTGIISNLLSKGEDSSALEKYSIDLGDVGFDKFFGNGLISLYYEEDVNTKPSGENNSEKTEKNDSNEEELSTSGEYQDSFYTLIDGLIGNYRLNYIGNVNYCFANWDIVHNNVPRSATLVNDGGYSIEKAYLIWISTKSPNPSNPVTLSAGGNSTSVSPANISWDYRIGQKSHYRMSADVTNFVKNNGYTTYTVGDIVVNQAQNDGERIAAWQLVIVEQNPNLPVRIVKINDGSKFLLDVPRTDMTITLPNGYKTKSTGDTTGQILFGYLTASTTGTLTTSMTLGNEIYPSIGNGKHLYKNAIAMPDPVSNSGQATQGIITFNLSDVYNLSGGQSTIKASVYNPNDEWNTLFTLGAAVDIDVPNFEHKQVASVGDDKTIINITGTVTNKGSASGCGIRNGKLHITIDNSLRIEGIANNNVIFKGNYYTARQVSSNEIEIDLNGTDWFEGESLIYNVNARVVNNSGQKTYVAPVKAYIGGRLISNNNDTGYDMPKIAEANSSVNVTITNGPAENIKLTVNPNGGVWEGNSNIQAFNQNYGTTRTISNPTWTGHIFNRWILSGNGSSLNGTTFKMGTENAYLTADWTAIKYNIAYAGNGATSGSTATSSHTYDVAKNLTPNGYKRAYTVTYNYNGNGQGNSNAVATYTFNGWATSASGSKVYNNSQSVSNLTTTNGATVTLYANWTSAEVTLPSPTRTGYIFAGWYDAANGGNKIGNAGAGYTPTANKTLYAHWTPITYNVAYAGNGATSGSTATSSHTYDVDKNLTANGYVRAYTVTYNYNGNGQGNSNAVATYIFNGWATSASGSKVYNNTQSVKNLTTINGATVTLYANWTSTAVILPSPSRTGHNFLGWYDAANGGNKVGNAGASYTPTENKILYAHWEPWTLNTSINLVDSETKNIIQDNANFKVYEYNKNTENYDSVVMGLTQRKDKTYITPSFLTYSDTNLGRFRIIEDTAPYGYYGDWKDSTETQKNYYDINIEEIIRTKNYNGQTVSDKGTINLTIENYRVKGKINVNIIDTETKAGAQADATLEGAIYGIYAKENIVHADGVKGILYKQGTLVQRATIVDGKLTYSNLELGEYYIKQITPPNGYTNSEIHYDVTLPYEGEKVELVERNITVEEKVNKQAFQLIKVGNVGGNDEFETLEGAGFKVYLISNLSKVKNGEIVKNSNGTYDLEDFKDYDFSQEQTALDYTNNTEGENIAEIFTDSSGYLLSPELAYGQYIVYESTVPEERVEIKPFFVTIEEDSRNPKKLRVFYDAEFTAKIQVIKKDLKTNKTVLKANAQYRILNKETNQYVEQWITYPSKQLLGTAENPYTTDETGTMTTPLTLNVGEYELQEVTAPNGYVLLGHEGKSQQGVYTAMPKENVSFKVSKTMVMEFDEDTQEAIMKVEQYNEEQLGSLTIDVSGEYLSGYTKDDNQNYNFEYQVRPIEGIEFTLYAKYNIYSQDNQNNVVYSKDEAVKTVYSNKDGKCIIDNLPIGIYYIKQTKVVDGFVLNKLEKEVEITYEEQEKAVVYRNEAYKTDRQKVIIQLINKDVDTGDILTGGKFALYTKDNINYIDEDGVHKTINADEMIYEVTADENGIARWDYAENVDLPLGTYYIKQIEAPYGYATNTDIVDINAKYRGQEKDVIEINIEFINQKTKINIVKQDVETKNGLEDVEMKLLNSEREEISSWTTDETGSKEILKLQPGETYIVQEVKARKDYINDIIVEENNNEITKLEEVNEVTFKVNDVLEAQNIVLENKSKVGNINIIKKGEVLIGTEKDENQNTIFKYEEQKLAGAEYEIYAKNDIEHPDGHTGVIITSGTKIANVTTTEEGILVTNIEGGLLETYSQEVQKMLKRGLPLGKYEVKEVKAPEGYYRDENKATQEIQLVEKDDNTEIISEEVNFNNERQKIQITLTNKDTDTEESIEGAKFGLYAKEDITYTDSDGVIKKISAGEKIYEVTTDENGMARWKYDENVDLPLGKYYVQQISAGNGYVKNNETYDVDATYQGQDEDVIEINIEFTNQKTKVNIVKQDVETKNGLEDVEIKLLNSKREEISSWTTDETGSKEILKLQPGETYIVQEVKARKDYINDIIVEENNNEITKLEEVNEVTFKVNDVLETQNIVLGNKSKVGNINIIKKGEVLVGTEKDENENTIFKYEEQTLAGAEYEFYAKNDIEHPDGHTGVIITSGTKVADAITTKEGILVTNIENELLETYSEEVQKMLKRGLPLGEYEVKEVKAPEGYYIDEEKTTQEVQLDEEDNNAEVVSKETIFINDRKMIGLEDNENGEKAGIYKYDEETKEPIQDVEFGIYTAEDITENGSVIVEKDTLILKAKTDKDGKIQSDVKLPLGKYYIKELKAAKGYEYDDRIIEFNIIDQEKDKKIYNMYTEISNKQTDINILKTDVDKNPLSGAKLQLLDSEGNVLKEWDSAQEAYNVKALETEKEYKIKEVEPTKGYVTEEEKIFTLDKYGNIIMDEDDLYNENTILIKDEKTKLQIIVVDEKTEEELSGVHVEIIDKETNEKVYEFDTKEEETIIEGLSVGNYDVIQKTEEDGYVTTHNSITIEDKKGVQENILKQKITKLNVKIKDTEEEKYVNAKKIQIKDINTGKIIASTERNEDEETLIIEKLEDGYYIERLPIGNYKIEVEVEEGYKEIDEQEILIKDEEELQLVELETRKLKLDMKVEKYLKNIVIDDKNQGAERDSISKIEIHRKAINKTKIELQYIIKVTNVGEIDGNIGKIIEEIPKGMQFEKDKSDSNWQQNEGILISTEYENKELKVGETKEYKVVLKWINGTNNFGSKVNTVKIEGITNGLEYSDNNEGDNKASVTTLFSIATGSNLKIAIDIIYIIFVTIISIGVLAVVEIRILQKKK